MVAFSSIVLFISAAMIIISGILFTIYSNEFFIMKAPLGWHIVSTGIIATGVVLALRPLVTENYLKLVWPIMLSVASLILVLGFAKLYTKSVKEAIK